MWPILYQYNKTKNAMINLTLSIEIEKTISGDYNWKRLAYIYLTEINLMS